MARGVGQRTSRPSRQMSCPMSLEEQEDQLVTLAVDLAMSRLRDGTASNQLIAEIIKMGTTKEKLAQEKLRRENEMLRAKTEAIESSKLQGELYSKAIDAMRMYKGYGQEVSFDDTL